VARAQAEPLAAGAPLDTLHAVEAPEGVDLALRLAGVVPRALAFGFDVSVRLAFYFFGAIPLVIWLGEVGIAVWFMLIALGEVIYPVSFELLSDGQTLGKRVVGIRVVHLDGTRIRWQASLLRNLLTAADALPGTYLFALASMLCSQRFQRIGDHAAGTVVVYTEGRRRADAATAPISAEPAPPAIPLSLEERAAVLAFGARARELSPERREELARLATPLLAPDRGSAAAQIEAIAAHLRGGAGAR
jgi:uncharacterized RDD family membrane protein YckC